MIAKIVVASLLAIALGLAGPAPAAERDGQHDFDALSGRWKIHSKQLSQGKWGEFDGLALFRPIWDGQAAIGEVQADGPDGHLEGVALRTYNPETRLWSLSWAESRIGVLGPALSGRFEKGQGEFFAADRIDGRPVYVRQRWSMPNPNAAHMEQALSVDGGRHWQTILLSDLARAGDPADMTPLPAAANTLPDSDPDGQHGFDGLIGPHWNFHLHRLNERLAGATEWTDFFGTGDCFALWNKRANLDTVVVNSPGGRIEGLTLRLFDPTLKVWRLYWANRRDGVLDVPQIGQFHDGHGDFYAQDIQNGHSVLVRFDWTAMRSKSPHFEQAFSIDGGRSWEVNWITDQTRND